MSFYPVFYNFLIKSKSKISLFKINKETNRINKSNKQIKSFSKYVSNVTY